MHEVNISCLPLKPDLYAAVIGLGNIGSSLSHYLLSIGVNVFGTPRNIDERSLPPIISAVKQVKRKFFIFSIEKDMLSAFIKCDVIYLCANSENIVLKTISLIAHEILCC